MSLPIIEVPGARALPPRVNRFTERFWNALAEGLLLGTRCTACARPAFPPRRHCPDCGARDTDWIELGGGGSIYAFTTIHAAPAMFAREVPYALVIVDLDDGPRLVTRLLDAPALARCDARIEMVVTRHDDGCLWAARRV